MAFAAPSTAKACKCVSGWFRLGSRGFASDLAVGRGLVQGTQAEQGLERRHRSAPAVVTEDVLVQVDGQVLVGHSAMGAMHPGLQIGDRAVSAWQQLFAGRRGALAARPVFKAAPANHPVAHPAIGVDDRYGGGGGVDKPSQRVARGIGQDAQAQTPRAAPANLNRDPDERLVAARTTALTPFIQATEVELVDLDLARQRLTLGRDHRVPQLLQDEPRRLIARQAQLALELLGRDARMVVATKYAAQNHVRSGVRVPCITVPAVTDVWWSQRLHCQTSRRRCIVPASPPAHPGHTNPSGQREANRYSRQASSVAKRSWKSMIERGNPGRGTPSSYESPQTEPTGYALACKYSPSPRRAGLWQRAG